MNKLNHRITIGVIPAAGAGKRMGYLSGILPKCLFPLHSRPVIHHIVDNMKGAGVEHIYVIVNYQKDKVIDYFRQAQDDINIAVDFIHQKALTGIADALLLTRDVIHEPFLTILGDDCTITESLDNLVNIFFQRGATVVEGIVEENNIDILKSTCCCKLDGNERIIEIQEKPRNPVFNLRGCGVYVFHPDIFEYIEKTPVSTIRNEIEITQTIALLAREGRAYGGFINGENININSYDDLLQAWLSMKKLKEGLLLPAV